MTSRKAKSKPLRLSHSQLYLYNDCPKKWHFKYVEGIPEKPKHFFSFGKTMHSVLEFLYKVKTPVPPSMEKLLECYEKEWISEGRFSWDRIYEVRDWLEPI